jgi:hypothetical protein
MKKLFSISFAFLILLSGMHLSIATHFCGGEIAAVKWSFSGEKATCGMETTKQKCPVHNGITSNCCHNKMAFLKVDKNYSPSAFQIKEVTKNILKVFYAPLNLSYNSLIASNSVRKNFRPPDNFLVSAVSLASVCVFRI